MQLVSNTYLLHNQTRLMLLASLGFCVVIMDGVGSSHRGLVFEGHVQVPIYFYLFLFISIYFYLFLYFLFIYLFIFLNNSSDKNREHLVVLNSQATPLPYQS